MLDSYDLHSDVFQSNSSSLGLSYNLFEANFAIGAGNLPNEHGALFQNQIAVSCSTGLVWRSHREPVSLQRLA